MVLPLISKGCMNMKSSVGTYTTPPHSGTLMLAQQHQHDQKNTSAKAVTMHKHKSAGALGRVGSKDCKSPFSAAYSCNYSYSCFFQY